MEVKLSKIISKEEAKNFNREWHEQNFKTYLMNKLIREINILLKVYYDDIEEESKKNNSFTIFEWKALDDDFYTSLGRKIRNSVFNEVTEMYESQNIFISFTCEQYQKRVSIKF
jgi:hypothetical protein